MTNRLNENYWKFVANGLCDSIVSNGKYILFKPLNSQDMNYHLFKLTYYNVNNDYVLNTTEFLIDIGDVYDNQRELDEALNSGENGVLWEDLLELNTDEIEAVAWQILDAGG